MREIACRTVVVGSGCAGLNAADTLASLGETDVLLVTENMRYGTSRNTGSDKQTYYKLSLAGDEGDSVGIMARDLKQPDVDGDLALCEAAGSAACFFKLVQLGVPFPRNEMGEFVGYQTDHDPKRRASSAGPLTSRYMTQALEESVRRRGVRVLENKLAFRLVVDGEGLCGLECLDLCDRSLLRIRCGNLILATGGPAGIYRNRVYPESQFGMSGMAFEAGACGANLDCWQYGLSSVGFRWNVSGSYQQALPRYVSMDADGTMHDFLSESLPLSEKLHNTFLKGYQWPFDPRKIPGSSQIDRLVKAQEDQGRRVFLDYRHNPQGYAPQALHPEARDYLARCGALADTPLERLRAINAPAIELYRDHGIDLETQMLEISVCAQHHNGGIEVDSHWQTCIPGLYACGEAAGTFGQYRPGGTALNSTQVGSMRAAQHIHRHGRGLPKALPPFSPPALPAGDSLALMQELQDRMTRHASFEREEAGMIRHLARLEELAQTFRPLSEDPTLVAERLRLRDLILTQRAVLSAMLFSIRHPGEGVLETRGGVSSRRPARPIPERELWFERVWQQEREERREPSW